jgi:predicted ATPase
VSTAWRTLATGTLIAVNDPLVKAVELVMPDDEREQRTGYPWDLSVIEALQRGLALHERVTYLIGENGSGKSTLLEAIAVAAGMRSWAANRCARTAARRCTSSLTANRFWR